MCRYTMVYIYNYIHINFVTNHVMCVFRILYIYIYQYHVYIYMYIYIFRLQPGLIDQHCDKPFATRMKSQSARFGSWGSGRGASIWISWWPAPTFSSLPSLTLGIRTVPLVVRRALPSAGLKMLKSKDVRCPRSYSGTLKLTNFTGTCQNPLRRRWIRKLNKLTKNKPNPHGTPVTNKLYLFKMGESVSSAKNPNFSTHFSVQFPYRWALWPKAQPSMWPGSPLQQLLGHRI